MMYNNLQSLFVCFLCVVVINGSNQQLDEVAKIPLGILNHVETRGDEHHLQEPDKKKEPELTHPQNLQQPQNLEETFSYIFLKSFADGLQKAVEDLIINNQPTNVVKGLRESIHNLNETKNQLASSQSQIPQVGTKGNTNASEVPHGQEEHKAHSNENLHAKVAHHLNRQEHLAISKFIENLIENMTHTFINRENSNKKSSNTSDAGKSSKNNSQKQQEVVEVKKNNATVENSTNESNLKTKSRKHSHAHGKGKSSHQMEKKQKENPSNVYFDDYENRYNNGYVYYEEMPNNQENDEYAKVPDIILKNRGKRSVKNQKGNRKFKKQNKGRKIQKSKTKRLSKNFKGDSKSKDKKYFKH